MRAKILFLAVVAGLAAALLFGLKERFARREAESALADRRHRETQLAAEIDRAAQKLAAVESEKKQVKVSLEAAAQRSAPAPAAAPVRSTASVPPEALARLKAMATDPVYQNQHLAEIRTRYAENYRPLARQLHLTEPHYAALIENLTKRYEQRLDLGFAVEKLPQDDGTGAVVGKTKQQIDDAFQRAQTELLGAAGYAQFEFYERSTPLRNFVDAWAGKVAIGGTPISAVQADGLIAAMAAASLLFQRGEPAQMQGLDWPAVLARAEKELSAPQLAAFRTAAIPYWNLDRLRELALKK